MFDKQELRRMAGSTVYRRGTDIYEEGGVLEFCVENEKADMLDRITAVVRGSGRKRYQVELAYDIAFHEIGDYYCECPAYYNYSGLCKHCVAAALKYMEHTERQSFQQNLGQILPMRQAGEHLGTSTDTGRRERRTASGYSPAVRKEPETTPEVKKLLGSQMVRRSLPVVQREICGRVILAPTLRIEKNELFLDLHVGLTHKYVVKDIFQFADRILQNEEFSYGQKLGFIHDISAFEPDSRPLVRFVLNWAENNRSSYSQIRYSGYAYQSCLQKLRSLPLKGDELEHFLEAVEGREFTAAVGGAERSFTLTEDSLLWELHLTGTEKGVDIVMDRVPTVLTNSYLVAFRQGLIYRIGRNGLEQIEDFISCFDSLPGGRAYVRREDAAVFCRELLPALEKFFRCSYENFSREDYGAEEASFEIYLDEPQKDMVTCLVKAVYGEKKYDVYGKQEVDIGRDRIKEMEVGSIVQDYCNAFDEENACMVLTDDEEKLYALLTEGLEQFRLLGEVYVSEALKHVRVAPSPKVELGVSLSGDLLEITMTAEDVPMEQLREILSRYNRKKKYYRLKNGDFIDMEGESIQALLEVKETLGITGAQIGGGRAEVPRYRALYLDEESREWEALSVVKNRDFRGLVRNMKTVEDNDFEMPDSMRGVLREYQKRGFLWLKTLKHNGFGAILADDMGLGKTLEVIAFLLSEHMDTAEEERKPALVVCPASLVYNWNSEIERFAPELPVRMIIGTAGEREELLRTAGKEEILITSYDLLKRDLAAYEGMRFSSQVIDEAQYIKNHNTQAARAVKKISAGFKLALTGTPIENRLSELWSIFDFLMPDFLYSYQHFKSTFEVPIVQNGEEDPAKRLQKMIRPFVLRRLKKDVLRELPDKLEENMYVRLEGEQKKLYDAHAKRLVLMLDGHSDEEFCKNKLQVLAELTRLRQLCCDPALIYEDYDGESAKTRLCVEMIKNAVNGGHKLLLFSQFTTMLSRLGACLEEEKISYYMLTGAVSKEKRRNMVEAFQRDDTSVFCISLKAGGTGLNLTAADMVVHYDPWWNLAVQNQATDRAHRIGQKNVVNVYRLIVKDTVEEKIVRLQERKRELAEKLLGGEGMENTDFSREELLELLRQDSGKRAPEREKD